MPNLAPLVPLLFLGSAFLTGLCVLVAFYGAARSSKTLAVLGAGSAIVVVVAYAFVLCTASLVSKEKNLPLGEWKYFCEIDCHIAYSVSGYDETGIIAGPSGERTAAPGHSTFVVVSLKTWFDEKTISPHRGNSPLEPGPRMVILLDESGRQFQRSSLGEAALARALGPSTSFGKPLRPGDSYITQMVFEIPEKSHARRLLVSDPDGWLDRFLIGHENSFLHKKVYLDFRSSAITVN